MKNNDKILKTLELALDAADKALAQARIQLNTLVRESRIEDIREPHLGERYAKILRGLDRSSPDKAAKARKEASDIIYSHRKQAHNPALQPGDHLSQEQIDRWSNGFKPQGSRIVETLPAPPTVVGAMFNRRVRKSAVSRDVETLRNSCATPHYKPGCV